MMKTKRCAVFDERDDRQCPCEATMVRTVVDGYVSRTFYCGEHGDLHGGVLIPVADRIRFLRTRAAVCREDGWVGTCDRALLGDEQAIEECVELLDAKTEEWAS